MIYFVGHLRNFCKKKLRIWM